MATASGKQLQQRNGPASEPASWMASGRLQNHRTTAPSPQATHSEEILCVKDRKRDCVRKRDGGRGAASIKEQEILKIFYTNVQSIQSKINELILYAADLDPDIILLTETWCNQSIPDAALSIPNYILETEVRRDRIDTTNGVGGGLLVYVKTGIRILPCDKFQDNEFNQFCSFKIKTKGSPLNIVLV